MKREKSRGSDSIFLSATNWCVLRFLVVPATSLVLQCKHKKISQKQSYPNSGWHDTKANRQSTVGRFAERHQCVGLSDTSCSSSQAKNNIFLMFPLWNNRQVSRGSSKLQSSSLVNRTRAGLHSQFKWATTDSNVLSLSLKPHMILIV